MQNVRLLQLYSTNQPPSRPLGTQAIDRHFRQETRPNLYFENTVCRLLYVDSRQVWGIETSDETGGQTVRVPHRRHHLWNEETRGTNLFSNKHLAKSAPARTLYCEHPASSEADGHHIYDHTLRSNRNTRA